MKRLTGFLTLISLVFWLVPSPASADEYKVIDGATAAATSRFISAQTGQDLGAFIDISGFTKVLVQATCTAACPASVNILVQTKATATDTFSTACTMVNPDVSANGLWQCIGPGAGYLQISTSNYVSGTYTVTVRTMK